MKPKKKIIRIVILFVAAAVLVGGGVGLYLFNKPARDIQNTKTDYSYNASDIVSEYLSDPKKANDKYLDESGNSKVLEISGLVALISDDFNKQKVVLLKADSDKAGVSCTFTHETNSQVEKIKIGDQVTIKGVIRSGASFDEDLDLYENVIIEKSGLVSK